MQALFRYLLIYLCVTLPSIVYTDVTTVPSVDLTRFEGLWYEIARLRDPWLRSCALNTTIQFEKNTTASLKVTTTCQNNGFFNKFQEAIGSADVIDPIKYTKFKLKFSPLTTYQWLYQGDYWIIQLADDYSYYVASNPTGEHVWILSRQPHLNDETYQHILDQLVLQFPNLNILNMMPTQQETKK